MASGGNSSRNLNKEKGPMHNLLEHVGGDVNYDRSYHEFLQDQFGSDHPSSPNAPLIIPEFDGLNHDPNTPNTNENLSNPPPPSNDFLQACVDDWTKAKYRQQELQPEIVNDFFEDDQTTGTEGSD
ncbi:hypothetical protein LWI28_004549 [Acer negundo]|uniref:Uncharacterized protein n=1 Tax=Acer negundo TaxID=4023 RepID=A0AAD5NHR8_ACENE|nr:hypothetical protein LWI28_004549 [Acer negundo]